MTGKKLSELRRKLRKLLAMKSNHYFKNQIDKLQKEIEELENDQVIKPKHRRSKDRKEDSQEETNSEDRAARRSRPNSQDKESYQENNEEDCQEETRDQINYNYKFPWKVKPDSRFNKSRKGFFRRKKAKGRPDQGSQESGIQ